MVSERRGSSPLRSLTSTGRPTPFGYQYECACGRAGRSPGWNARPSPPGALSTSRRASAAIGAPPARSRISPASTNPASEYSASSVRGPGFPAPATNCRRVGVTRGWSNTRMKNASGGSFIPDVWPSRSRTVASGSPRHAGHQRRIGSSRRRRPCSTSRIAVDAVTILVMLSNGIAVSVVIGRRGCSTASPAAPDHSRPSANTTAAVAPGTPVSSTFSLSAASRRWAAAGENLTPGARTAAPLSAPPQPTRARSTAQATAKRAMCRRYMTAAGRTRWTRSTSRTRSTGRRSPCRM